MEQARFVARKEFSYVAIELQAVLAAHRIHGDPTLRVQVVRLLGQAAELRRLGRHPWATGYEAALALAVACGSRSMTNIAP
ncbi:MAG TPA: hypothetical protein VJS42_03655, partial [Steroidobacteraceae bacterium]|nr:hypothetical protein [Steroidobacteraceae bacterium]